MMDHKSIADAVQQICDEKGISFESVIETIEAALAAAYRKDFGNKLQNIKVDFDIETGGIKVFDIKTVVEDVPEEELAAQEAAAAEGESLPPRMHEHAEVDEDGEEVHRFNPKTDMQISEAKALNSKYELGDTITTELEVPGDFGRMAAQTAKQVITQKIRETERETIFDEYKDREGEIIVGTVQRRERRIVLIDLGRATGVMPPEEEIPGEKYLPGASMKFYIVAVRSTTKGPEIVLSRAHADIVKQLFTLEIPEIASGVVEIKGVSREAGSRSKVAVWTDDEGIDPIGSCIGQRGARIQTIISELKGEKVDIIKYSDNPVEFITNALSPAKILSIETNEEEKEAVAKVAEDQLSLAIGKAGQNVRLAARLTGWKIDIVSENGGVVEDEAEEGVATENESEPTEEVSAEEPTQESNESAEEGVDTAEEEK